MPLLLGSVEEIVLGKKNFLTICLIKFRMGSMSLGNFMELSTQRLFYHNLISFVIRVKDSKLRVQIGRVYIKKLLVWLLEMKSG